MFRRVNRRSGLALVLVMLVLAALIAIAAPFLVSMVQQEGTSRNYLDDVKARIGADNARSAAIVALLRTHETAERAKDAKTPFDTPDVDTLDEIEMSKDLLGLPKASAFLTSGIDATATTIPVTTTAHFSVRGVIKIGNEAIEYGNISYDTFTNVVRGARGTTAKSHIKGAAVAIEEIVTNDPRGLMWDGHVEDEQGKINLRTAPRHIVDNLLRVVDPKTSRLERYLTEFSNRPIQWGQPDRIRRVETATLADDKKVSRPVVNEPPNWPLDYAPGTRVRITDGQTSIISYVVLDYEEDLALSCAIPGSMNQTYLLIQPEVRHPVNINTASREVIAAVLMGLSVDKWKKSSGGGMGVMFIDPDQPDDGSSSSSEAKEVSQKEAVALAERLVKKTYLNMQEVFDVIDQAVRDNLISKRDREAIEANIIDPSSLALKDTGTAPFCLRSYDVFSVEAIGAMNSPAGTQTASHAFREVMSVVPLGPRTWKIQNQYDFTNMMGLCGSNLVVAGPNFGVVSTSGWNAAAQKAGDLRVHCPADGRGGGVSKLESFDGAYDGLATIGAMPYDFSDKTIPAPQPGADLNAGGIEMWIKPSGFSGGRTYFFDFAQSEFENRIALYYDGSDLVLCASDATVDRWELQVRHTVQLQANTWYHLGAYWKGTSYGHLCLALDGIPVGTSAHVDENGSRALAFLTSDITDTSTNIPVTTTANFPVPSMVNGIQKWGVIEIGDEAIEYSGITSGAFTNVVRGARGTTAKGHITGAAVTIFGYSNTLSTKGITISAIDPSTGEPTQMLSIDLSAGIPVVKGLLADSIGERPEATINRPSGGPGDPGGITDVDTTIPVSPSTDGFPTKGFIKIRNEVIYYGSKTATSFESCQRGAPLGGPTTARPHPNGARIVPFAIPVTDITGYPNPTIVQIDDEWLAGQPAIAQEDGGGYIMGWIFAGIFVRPPFRGDFFETGQAEHIANAKVIPVFSLTDKECGRNDMVTIIETDQTQQKEQMEIRNAKVRRTIDASIGGMQVQITIGNLAAFMDFTKRAYAPDKINRLLKFPSGELASFVTGQMQVCGVSPNATSGGSGSGGAGATGTIDELRFFQSQKGDFRLAAACDDQAQTLQMNGLTGIEANGGAVKIGDEIVGFALANQGSATLEGCKRGYLKTTAAVHDEGERAFNLSFFSITPLAADVSATDAAISLRGGSGLDPQGGYLLVEDEVIGYSALNVVDANSATASMPADMTGKGMYRGAYGTDAAGHAADTLAYAIPFRYWDRFSPQSYDNTLVRFHATLPVIDAVWKRIYWMEAGDNSDPNLDVHMKVRIDSRGEWESAQPGAVSTKKGTVFLFNEPTGKNAINELGSRVEIRCLFEYKKGSFQTNSWKKTIRVTDIYVDYDSKTTTMSRRQER